MAVKCITIPKNGRISESLNYKCRINFKSSLLESRNLSLYSNLVPRLDGLQVLLFLTVPGIQPYQGSGNGRSRFRDHLITVDRFSADKNFQIPLDDLAGDIFDLVLGTGIVWRLFVVKYGG